MIFRRNRNFRVYSPNPDSLDGDSIQQDGQGDENHAYEDETYSMPESQQNESIKKEILYAEQDEVIIDVECYKLSRHLESL
jgi:hypothetical protein